MNEDQYKFHQAVHSLIVGRLADRITVLMAENELLKRRIAELEKQMEREA